MFEQIYEQMEGEVKLTPELNRYVAQDISNKFSNWDEIRLKQKNIAEKLRPEIYLDERPSRYLSEDDSWKSDMRFNKIYSLFQTEQAYIWSNIYANIENVFDVSGVDEKSAETAALQKRKLINLFYKIKIQRKLDEAIEHLSSIGEICLFVSWQKKHKLIRRPYDQNLERKDEKLISKNGAFAVLEKQIYNGANVEAVNPLNLVFDPGVSPEDMQKWDECGKIIKSFETYSSIASNKLFKLSKDQLNDIKAMLLASGSGRTQQDKTVAEKTQDVIDHNRIEVLQYWGDYTLENGKVLKNWHIVVIGRKYTAVFEMNRWVINPIINMALFRDYASKRGIPVLWSIYSLCKEQENKLNLENDAQALNLNPPAYAPEGFFKENKIKLFPGKQVEYKQGLEDPTAIIKMSFPLIDNSHIISYYDQSISDISGIFPNMKGQIESHSPTATEINMKVEGQTTRLGKTIDAIKQNVIIPMVEKVAELEANMKFGDETIRFDEYGSGVLKVIDDQIRQGNYEYNYTDGSTMQKRLMENQKIIEVFQMIWNDQEIPLNKIEIVREVLRNTGMENTDKFLNVNTSDPSANINLEKMSSAGIPTGRVPQKMLENMSRQGGGISAMSTGKVSQDVLNNLALEAALASKPLYQSF